MKVLLINPPYTAEQRYGKDLAQFGPCTEPLGLAYVAGALEQAGHEVRIWDGQIEQWPLFPNKYELIGITMLTPAYDIVKEMCEGIKKLAPNIPIVLGGPHPTVMAYDTQKEIPEVNLIVQGEGERAILDAVKPPDSHNQGMIYYPPIDNLDDLPLPARHLLPMKQYQITATRNKGHHAYTVIVARGCPYQCTFCCRLHGHKLRFHSVDRVIQEIELLVRDYDAKEINLEADTITVNRTWLYSLCDGLIQSGLNHRLSWTCESRVDTVDEALLRFMKLAGCWQISYGVESGSQRLLDFIKKGITLEQVKDTFNTTKKVGINIRAFFMLGIPTETREESYETIRFAQRLKANWSQFTLCVPFPGTELYGWVQKNEPKALSQNWGDYKTHGGWAQGNLAYFPTLRSQSEMKSLQKEAYRKVYLQPGKVWQHALKVRSFRQLWENIKGAWVLMKTRFA